MLNIESVISRSGNAYALRQVCKVAPNTVTIRLLESNCENPKQVIVRHFADAEASVTQQTVSFAGSVMYDCTIRDLL